MIALFTIAGCGSDDGGGVSVGPGNNTGNNIAQNNTDLDAGTDGTSANSGVNNTATPDAGPGGACAAGDLTSCPTQPGAMPTGCDTSGSAAVCEFSCEAGRSDLNGDLGTEAGDGCESNCVVSNGGTEICDGLDNDCNGETDEGFSVGDACSDGAGLCEDLGTIVCLADGTSACDASAGTPQNEICDGLDNDCDGTVDEENPGGGGRCDTGLAGACGAGVETCSGGSIVCDEDVQPIAEACGGNNTGDGVDNDCDGDVDEGCASCTEGTTQSCYTGPAGTDGTGACRSGTQTCTAGQFGSCSGEVVPSAETCNNNDDDCDGVADEDFADKSDACTVGTGQCASSGVRICTADATATTCNATAGTPGTETCNNVDDDCDGQVDEGLTRTCGSNEGVCSAGTETCSTGAWGSCQGGTSATTELCNGLDDDCDGTADDGFGVGGSCSVGQGACQRSGEIVCSNDLAACDATPGSASAETCNGVDDDCDGSVDENLSRNCGTAVGACTTGTETCSSGSFGSCSGVGPVAETCNSVDDDCDGSTDEDFTRLGDTCSAGVGACRRSGTYVCAINGLRAICSASAGTPGTEVCGDGIDNDCDGTVDERCLSLGCSTSADCRTVGEECCYNQLTMQTECLNPVDPNGNQRLCIQQ